MAFNQKCKNSDSLLGPYTGGAKAHKELQHCTTTASGLWDGGKASARR